MFRWYNGMLHKYPLPTKMITSGFLFGLGDVICQKIEQSNKDKFVVDKKRLARFSFFGCFMGAPVLNFHYGTILQWVSPKTTPLATLAKVTVDQTLFAPFFITYIFMTLPLMEGKTLEDGKKSVREKLWPSLLTNWKVWPLVQFLNFYLIPLRYHLLVVNTVAVWWNAYMSWMCNNNASAQLEISSDLEK